MRSKTIELFTYIYPNGTRVKVTNHGVTLWDNDDGRWVMDASCVFEDSVFVVNDLRKGDKLKKIEFPALYPKKKVKKHAKN